MDQVFAECPGVGVCREVVPRSSREVGDGWYGGSGSVQEGRRAADRGSRELEWLVAAAA